MKKSFNVKWWHKSPKFIKRIIDEDLVVYSCWSCEQKKLKENFTIIRKGFCICKKCYREHKRGDF